MIRNKESLTSSRYFISIERSIFNGRVATSNECKSDFQLVEPGVDVINALNWVAESIYNLLGAGTGNHPTREASSVAMIYPPLQVSIKVLYSDL